MVADAILDPLLGVEEGGGAVRPDNATNAHSIASKAGKGGRGIFSPADGPTKLDLLEGLDGREFTGAGTANQFQTIFNILNLYIGIGTVLIGYVVSLGGWASLLFLLLFSAIFCFTARLLCCCFEKLPQNAEPNYPVIGSLACGPAGQWAVLIIVVTEFFGDTCVLLITIWKTVAILFPPTAGICLGSTCLSLKHSVILGSLLAILPAIWLRGFSKLTLVAVSGVVSSLLVTAVMVGTLMTDPSSAKAAGEGAHQHTFLRAASLPSGIGVMAVSLSGHGALPSIKRSMRQPKHFERCLYIAFGSMFLLTALAGAVSYQYFGESCSVLVTHSLATSSAVAGWVLLHVGSFQISIAQLLSALVALSAFSTIAPLVLVLADVIIDMARGTANAHVSSIKERALRTVVLMAAYAVSVVAYDVLGLLLSLIGGVASMCSSVLLPSIFYYVLHQNNMIFGQRVLVGAVVCLGTACVILIASIDVQQL
jgi:amino acid permease